MEKSNINGWLKQLSLRSLQKIKAIIEITLSELEIIGISIDKKEYSIATRAYNKENFSLIEVRSVVESLNREASIKLTADKYKGFPEITLIINDKDILKKLKNVLSTIDKIIKKSNSNTTKSTFNNENGVLIFKNTEIDFSKKYNQKELLNSLFKNKAKNWNYDEIIEDWGEDYQRGDWRKCYTAGDEINKEIIIKTGVNDFIIKNTKQIRINSKYI